MLTTMVEHVIGIDPDRDRITASVVDTATTGEQASAVFETTRVGYDRLLKWADQHTQTAGRVWSVEGTGSYGAGLTSHLAARGERATEFNHPNPTTGDGTKTDALDARRAARQILGRSRPSTPRVRGDREALRVLETTRRGAITARTSAINELKALLVTAPIDLRDQLRDLSTASLVAKCRRFRLASAPVNELTATKAGHAFCSPANPCSHHRSSRTGNNYHRTGYSRRSLSARPARDRSDHRRSDLYRLVTPSPMPQRSSVRSPRRCSTPRGVLRATHPSPAKPLR